MLLWAGQLVVWISGGGGDFFSKMNRPALGTTQLPIARLCGALPPGVKWPGTETDHSFLLSVKFEWNYATSPSPCLHGMYGDAFTFCCENFASVRHVYYVQMVCWPILFLPHVAESVDTVVNLLLVVVGVVAEVIAVLLRGGAGVFVTLVLLFMVVLMTVVITVVVVLVKATFSVAWNIVKIWAFIHLRKIVN